MIVTSGLTWTSLSKPLVWSKCPWVKATKWLFEDLQIPGCGYFSTLNDSLLLSKSKQTYKSEWKLPSFFYKNLSQVHHKTWEQSPEGFCTVKTGIGQEFIAQLTEQGEEWVRDLFIKNKKNSHI